MKEVKKGGSRHLKIEAGRGTKRATRAITTSPKIKTKITTKAATRTKTVMKEGTDDCDDTK